MSLSSGINYGLKFIHKLIVPKKYCCLGEWTSVVLSCTMSITDIDIFFRNLAENIQSQKYLAFVFWSLLDVQSSVIAKSLPMYSPQSL